MECLLALYDGVIQGRVAIIASWSYTPLQNVMVLDQGGCLALYSLTCRVDHTAGVDRIRYGCGNLTAFRGRFMTLFATTLK